MSNQSGKRVRGPMAWYGVLYVLLFLFVQEPVYEGPSAVEFLNPVRFKARVKDAAEVKVGPGRYRYRSPRHRTPFNSGNEGSKSVGWQISLATS